MVKDKDLGIAIKVEDGNIYRPLSCAAMEVLNQLGLLSEEENEELRAFAHPAVLNDHKWVVGEVRPALKLEFAGK